MSYNIQRTDGNSLIELDDEVIDTETLSGIGLIGRLTPNYGKTQSDNFVHLVENFADTKFPENPLKGQICYKKESEIEGSLYLCVDPEKEEDERWKKLPLVFIGDTFTGTNLADGDMWYDTKNHVFKIYDSTMGMWMEVGPLNFNDTKSVIKTTNEITADTSDIQLFDFSDGNNWSLEDRNKSIGYLITLSVIGKEISKQFSVGEEYDYNISGWKVQLVVNYIRKNSSSVVAKIVGKPDYELIGTNKPEWKIEAYIGSKSNGVESLLMLKVNNSTGTESTKKWVIKMDMVKVD